MFASGPGFFNRSNSVTTGPLLHFDGSNGSTVITDSHGGSSWTAVSGAQLSTAQAKFGPSSLLVNGGYVNTSDMGGSLAAEFCIQGWAYNTGSPRGIFQLFPDSSAGSLALGWDSQWQVYHNGAVTNASGSTLPTGWFHWAVYRSSGIIYAAINGSVIISVADTGNFLSYKSLYVGIYYNNGYPWTGYIDEVKVDLTTTPYGSSNFTPPSSPFT